MFSVEFHLSGNETVPITITVTLPPTNTRSQFGLHHTTHSCSNCQAQFHPMKVVTISISTATRLPKCALSPPCLLHVRSVLTAAHPHTITNSHTLKGLYDDGSVRTATCSMNGTAWHSNQHKHKHNSHNI